MSIRSTKPRSFSSLNQEPSHDGLAGAGIVGEEEPDAGQLHEVFVDGLKLVGQRVHAGDGEAEVGVELMGDAQGVGLQSEFEEFPRRRRMRRWGLWR